MISKLPWRLDEDGMIIYDAEGEIVAVNYRFNHVDDFEAICRLINEKEKLRYRIIDE